MAMVVALGASALALARPAGAGSVDCRGAIAKGLSKLANTGFKLNDKCHKTQDQALMAAGACNDVKNSLFDPTGKYANAATKSGDGITKKCLPGDPALDNYDGKDPQTAVGAVVDETVGGNSAAVVDGNTSLAGDKAKIKCNETIGKTRTKIAKEIVKNSTKCQEFLDKTASTFGPLNSACVDQGTKSVMSGQDKISAACGSSPTAGSDAGSCDPLPGCATDAVVAAAQGIAKAIYQKVTPPSECGDGIVNGTEQCDDGINNGTPGDPCNANCESLLETCGPGTVAGGTINGHRVVKITLDVPAGKKLAGVRVGFDYPQLEASIKGTGTSTVVQSSFQVLVAAPPDGFLTLANDTDTDLGFIISSPDEFLDSTAGAFLQITMDECTPLSENICNRNQQVTGCCPTTDIVACNAAPDDPVACFCGANGIISQADCNTAGCSLGVCVGIPPAPAGSCDDPGTKKCKNTSPNPGKACTAANEAVNCSGVAVNQATCTINHACSRLGDQTNGTYGCGSIFNPPGAPNGSFGNPGPVGPPTVPPALPGSCPTNNTCVDQAQQMEASCTVTQPVDHNGTPVDGVSCSMTITEAP